MSTFVKMLFPAVIFLSFSCSNIHIDEIDYEGARHFKIKTLSATYYLDKAGGGMSRILDADGVDWVNYRGPANAGVPQGAESGFRGLPNFVFRSSDGGAGHPGFDQCVTEQLDYRTVRTVSKSGKWEWLWKFYDNYFTVTVEKADDNHAYWFLYEGPVAGSFDPHSKYWGTDQSGPRTETPSLNHGESISGHWQWVYFGDHKTDRIMYVAQNQKDENVDFFSYMGSTAEGKDASDGMVVFGFGRDQGALPLMKKENARFTVGFLERKIMSPKDHEWVGRQVLHKILE